MHFETDYGVTYKIVFQYVKDTQNRVKTHCALLFKSPNEGAYTTSVFTGTALCHEADRFNKEEGRKLALKRALKSMNSKVNRTRAWAAYRGRGRKSEVAIVPPVN